MTRRPSPLAGARPTRADLARFATDNPDAIDDVLPASGMPLRLLIVGINPGLWTAKVGAPFARPGNRFWPALHLAGITDRLVDCSAGMSAEDERHCHERGLGITNLVPRATARADEVTREELRAAPERLARLVARHRPEVVAVAGITAYRTAFGERKATMGRQPTDLAGVELWVVPNPSGLNAHETVATLAQAYAAPARAAGVLP